MSRKRECFREIGKGAEIVHAKEYQVSAMNSARTNDHAREYERGAFGIQSENGMREGEQPPTTRIFFIHVMKVGGTSLVALLQRLFDPAEVCPGPPNRIWDASYLAEARRYMMIHGHFDMDFMRAIGKPGATLCMLRNPYDRIRSLYDFWRSHTWHAIREGLPPVNGQRFAKLVTFEEFVLSGNAFIRERVWNAATRQLLGKRYEELADNPERAALEAFEVLKSLDWFGISELSQESLRRLSRTLNITLPPEMPRLNQTYERAAEWALEREAVIKTVPLRSEYETIAATNRSDTLLYDWALRWFLANAPATPSGYSRRDNLSASSFSSPNRTTPAQHGLVSDDQHCQVRIQDSPRASV
jgi:Sulfotransferase family